MSETWFLILRKEYILRAFNNIVRRMFNCNMEEVMESWTELLNSQFMSSSNDVYVAVKGVGKIIKKISWKQK